MSFSDDFMVSKEFSEEGEYMAHFLMLDRSLNWISLMYAKVITNTMEMNDIMMIFLPFPGFTAFFILKKVDLGNELWDLLNFC